MSLDANKSFDKLWEAEFFLKLKEVIDLINMKNTRKTLITHESLEKITTPEKH